MVHDGTAIKSITIDDERHEIINLLKIFKHLIFWIYKIAYYVKKSDQAAMSFVVRPGPR